MRYIVLIILLIMNVYLLTGEVVDEIIAKVGREVILRSDLESQKLQMEQMGILTPDITEKDIINEMIETRLVLQTAKERNYRIDEHRVRQMVDAQVNEQIARIGSEDLLRAELRRLGMTLSDLRNYYEEIIREQRLKEMIIQNEIVNRIHVTDVEIEEFYRENLHELPLRPETVELGMIAKEITASESAKRDILNSINRIYDRLREGADFGDLAMEYSDCPSAAMRGDLGFFGRGTMIREFEEVAFQLKPGEISDVVATNFGYHIIKMEEQDEEDIRVRHILKMVEPSEEDVSEITKTMEDILTRLKEGEDFQQIAKDYSDDDNAREGGVIGEFPHNEYPEMFKPHLENIGLGEYTKVIREGNHLYIFGKLRTIPEREYELAEIKEELREFLTTQKQVDHYDRWITNLREDSYVEILIN